METEWTKEELSRLMDAYNKAILPDGARPFDGFRAAASEAVTLFLSRAHASAQVAEDLARRHKRLESNDDKAHAAADRLAAGAQRVDGLVASLKAALSNADEAQKEAEALRVRVSELEGRLATEESERIRCRDGWAAAQKERALDNSEPAEALHADLSDQLRAAWEATGAAAVRGMTTLADVVGVTKNDLREALQSLSSARAEADRLAPLEHEVKRLRAEAADAERSARASIAEVDRLRAEVTGGQERSRMLLDAKNHWADRARAAESRLAAIRERAGDESRLVRVWQDAVACGSGSLLLLIARWVLEGDTLNHSASLKSSSNSPGVPDGSSRRQDDVVGVCGSCGGSHPFRRFGDMWRCSNCGDGFTTFPCSTTCTHDDARTPGHPERVKEGSEAVSKAAHIYRCACGATMSADDAFTTDGGTGFLCRSCRSRDEGTEAMRAACWEAVRTVLQAHGQMTAGTTRTGLADAIKAAIEGAVS